MSNEEEMIESDTSSDSEDDEGPQENEEMEVDDGGNETGENQRKTEVFLPGKTVEQGEELVCDPTAYVMYHQAQTSAPCLSFDVIPDSLGESRDTYPLTAYLVAGTQAPTTHVNNVIVMKLTNLHKTTKSEGNEEEDDDEDSGDESDEKRPRMLAALMKHQGCVNRIRSTVINGTVLAASWSELGRVNIWNLKPQLQAIESDHLLQQYNKENKQNSTSPLFTFSGHKTEGFAMDWSPTMSGVLATGDCRKDIHIWNSSEACSWQVDQRPLIGHQESVEDLQWSPNERNVLASCSVDKSIRIWDTRANPSKACMITAEKAHESDVNVISWNRNEPFIVSGGDDGFLHVWDLRTIRQQVPLATFKHHTEPVTTVEWHPTDSAVFASGGSDNQIALWDLSVEKDDETKDEIEGVPPQLLFIHQGQDNIKELHWHKQLPGVVISTAESGFNIFRTISV
ncbi:glutamate-rich WD repeat-containing protein 1 isoform X2 [Anthonomus grandis grandis]|uniref:glutamate-rich WD repeat-containing protein 1 isoform X2 n=1 Tax=Anthonomus grandis grandis TaxID=2921223 RepID=UPI0021669196|nr:glutamate-rich WD repeat-containing protein 1 isoform X2 [Anthonomus grandis grandis]